ncbi:MAG: ammonia-forming cytochrome c nitrite reductase subunit c552 [Deltaproteobacteria bacterium]|nr:ammonia-forming cytochrome c nitrite reductase subunit c552 [Deltaproteobacteria bacterium]
MSETRKKDGKHAGWVPWAVFGGALAATFVLGMVVVTVMERRWETTQPQLVVTPVAEWETDNAVWGQNYPREYETYLETKTEDTRTEFGGSFQRDYLEDDPRQVILFAGYGFSKDFKQARGHYWAVDDIRDTGRTTRPDGTDTGMPGTCWTCKSPDVPRLMNERGIAEFYNDTWLDLKEHVEHPIGCLDCHDPETMNLRVSRPALREAFARQGKDIDEAGHQEMRSLVCAQCHVEYYFGNNPDENKDLTFAHKGKYLVHPWDEGLTVDEFDAYFEKRPDFHDWVHPISGTHMIKMQHPDWEVFETGIHAFRGVSCADCHMPYRSEGGVKFTNHHVQSPLLDIASSCGVCHRWSEAEVKSRVETIQQKNADLRISAEDALVFAHFDVAACIEAGASDTELEPLRDGLWRAQMRWDYVAANNGMGFHSPQECARVLADAIDLAHQVRILAVRLLAIHGITQPPAYPDISTRAKALAVITAFEKAAGDESLPPPSLLTQAPAPPPADEPPPSDASTTGDAPEETTPTP